jgi:aspartate/methionine/tyrosine aminotransferase
MAGAGAVLEALFHAIADAGEGVLVPTPSYAGFWPDLTLRDGLVIVPVHTAAADSFRLTPRLLDEAVAGSPVPIRALLYTNPDNPLGRVASRSELEVLVAWARGTGVQLVVDEIYALSVFGASPFTSVASLGESLGEDVHVVWAFSKDFAMSGLRCGVLVTQNSDVRAAVASQAVWGSVSTLTQAVLSAMLEDDAWIGRYLAAMRGRLGAMHAAVTAALAAAGIRHIPAEAGFFVLVDLREFLDEPTWEAEDRLWRRLLDEGNVNLTPGSACRIVEPGFFRLCYAALPVDHVIEGIRRLGSVVQDGRRPADS